MKKAVLVPTDSLTQRLLVEILAAMYMHQDGIEKAIATSELPRPDVATASPHLVQANTQSDFAAITVLEQGELSSEDRMSFDPKNAARIK